jgi:hypothetical protein
VGGLIIGHYLSWTSIFNLFSFTEIRQKWLLFLLFGFFSLRKMSEVVVGGDDTCGFHDFSVCEFLNVGGMRRSSFPREKVKTAYRHQKNSSTSFPILPAYMGRNRFIGSRNHLFSLDDVVCVYPRVRRLRQ